MEIADTADDFKKPTDPRPTLPEPPTVRLIAVADVRHLTPPGVERELDALYVGVLGFEREDEPIVSRPVVEPILGDDVPKLAPARQTPPLPPLPPGVLAGPVYRAERFRVCFAVCEPPIERVDLKPTGIEVQSLPGLVEALQKREIEFTRQRGMTPGEESLLLLDPGGNWIEVSEVRRV